MRSVQFLIPVTVALAASTLWPWSPTHDAADKGSPRPATSPTTRHARPQRVVFVLDASGSMLDIFGDLSVQTLRAIDQLGHDQSFNVICMQEHRILAADRQHLLGPVAGNRQKALTLLANVVPRATCDPLPGLDLAFKLRPEVVYLLADGDFDPGHEKVIEFCHAKQGQARIHTFALIRKDDPPNLDLVAALRTIAKNSGGEFRVVNEDDFLATGPRRIFDRH